MPKNLKGGSKHKKMKNTSNSSELSYDDVVFKDSDEQDYGKVEKILGNGRFTVLCNDKVQRLGIIRGNMRKKKWVNLGNIILYSIRPYETDKIDIIYVYDNNVLKNVQHRMQLNFNISDNNEDDDIFDVEHDSYNNDDINKEIKMIPVKEKPTNIYYNFSDSEESDEDTSTYQNEVVDDQFIDDL